MDLKTLRETHIEIRETMKQDFLRSKKFSNLKITDGEDESIWRRLEPEIEGSGTVHLPSPSFRSFSTLSRPHKSKRIPSVKTR